MSDFSIEIITRGEKSLSCSLESIRSQTYNSYEIVCANSSLDSSIIKILDDYSVKHLEVAAVRHLRGREMSHSISAGKYSLIMDSTRLLNPNALDLLRNYIQRYEMVAIKEGSIGTGFWANQAKIYKDTSEKKAQTISYEL